MIEDDRHESHAELLDSAEHVHRESYLLLATYRRIICSPAQHESKLFARCEAPASGS